MVAVEQAYSVSLEKKLKRNDKPKYDADVLLLMKSL